MLEKVYDKLQPDAKIAVLDTLRTLLKQKQEILFAYLHGSFAQDSRFRDIDLALYLKDMPSSPLEYELAMETAFAKTEAGYPVDVRILNCAPLSYKYHVIKDGMPLIVNNDDERSDFVEATLSQYFDFAQFRKLYLKETLGIGA